MVLVNFQHARKSVLGNSGSASEQSAIAKFWKYVVDRSALDSIQFPRTTLPLLATFHEISEALQISTFLLIFEL